MSYPKNRGNSLFGFLIAFAIGGLIGAGIACLAGWICGHGGGGGGGGGSAVQLTQNQCTSSPNACGLVNIGTCSGGSSAIGGGGSNSSCTCNATPPDNSQCPTPVIPDNGFTANPSIITTPTGQTGQTTLTWQSTNTTSCSVSGDNGFSFSGQSNDSTVASGLTTTTTFTLTCEDGPGGPTASKSLKVIVNAHYREQ